MSGGPAPQGAGGLKYMDEKEITVSVRSRPARGGWIEILVVAICCALIWSRPARGGWIEIVFNLPSQNLRPSRPARGGWIEIDIRLFHGVRGIVPPRKGRVD